MQYISNKAEFMKKMEMVVDAAEKETAERVRDKARAYIQANAKRPTGALASSTVVYKSKFENGGHIVYAHGDLSRASKKRQHYAIFVEFGTSKMRPIPFLRSSLKGEAPYLLKALRRRYKARIEAERMRAITRMI
jgi:HK97 gp10 family phage protein